jgi:NNP family nitrate/nitrite transporter-like MFS transporter
VAFLLAARNAPAAPQPKRTVSYFALFSHEPLAWTLSLFYFLTFGGFVALSIYLPTLLHDTFQLAMADAGARVAGFVVVATVMRPVGGFLADRHGGAQVLGAVMPLAAAMALGLTSHNMIVFTLAALSLAALLGAGNGAVFKLVPACFPRHTGAITGLVGAAGGLGGFFPPLVMGFMKLRTGSYDVGFILLCCFALFCTAVNYVVFLRPFLTGTHRRKSFIY